MDICRASGHFLSTLYHISTHHLFIITIEEKHDNVFKQHQETGKCTAQKVFSQGMAERRVQDKSSIGYIETYQADAEES